MRTNWPLVYQALNQWGISSKLNCVGVIGTIAKETASTFQPVREAYYLDEAARWAWYNNTSKHAPYDGGPNYHGRGYVQTTHKYNYQHVQDKTDIPCVDNPDLLLEPANAAQALCVFWTDHNLAALCEARNWAAVRRGVYGGNDPDGIARIQYAESILLG